VPVVTIKLRPEDWLAYQLQNPRLLREHFHTLRHWKATMEYHRTKDILHVMNVLGHKNIRILWSIRTWQKNFSKANTNTSPKMALNLIRYCLTLFKQPRLPKLKNSSPDENYKAYFTLYSSTPPTFFWAMIRETGFSSV
jgi:hypothetical protein